MYKPGKSKGYIRDSVFLFLLESNCKHVLTLPNLYFGLEKKLLDKGIKVDCSEYSVNTFKKQREIAPKGITLHSKNVADIDLSKYDGIFFDFYGTFNKSLAKALPRIEPGTSVAFTFLMARENLKLQKIINIKRREKSYCKLLYRYGVDIEKYANYNDSSPMCVFFGTKF